MKKVTSSVLLVLATAGFAMAGTAVGVDVNTPNVRVRVGTPQPPLLPPPVTVVEHERVIVQEREIEHRDHGKHKGHYKKHHKHKHGKHDD